MAYINGNNDLLLALKGDSAFIRYSAHADGADFTEEWSEGQNYIGFATGQTAPTDKSGYEWITISVGDAAKVAAQEAAKVAEEEVERLVGELGVVQITGDSPTAVMSQRATTDAIKEFGFQRETFTPVNILDSVTLTETRGAMWGANGEISSTQYTGNYTAINEHIDVIAGHTYKLPSFYGVMRYFYESGAVGDAINLINTSTYMPEDYEIIIPEGVNGLGLSYAHTVCTFTGIIYRLSPTVDEKARLLLTKENFLLLPKNLQDEKTQNFIKGLSDFPIDEEAFTPINILEEIEYITENGVFWSDGGLVSTQYTAAYTSISPLLDVIEGCIYKIPNFCGAVSLYDENGGNRETINNVTYPYPDLEIVIPQGKVKMGVSFLPNTFPFLYQIYRMTPTEGEKNSLPIKNESLSIIPNNLKRKDTISLLAPLKNKVIVNFGDSIFGNARPPEDISTRLAELTGALVHNCGFGGCRMSYHPYASYDAFSMCRLADAITTGDFTLQTAALSDTTNEVPSYFAVTLALLKSIDFNEVDIITIAYGTNDFNGQPLDDDNDKYNQRSFAGALRYSIEKIIETFPHIRIFVCSQYYRYWKDDNGNFSEDTDTSINVANNTTLEFVEKTKEVANEYKLPYIDNYHSLGINKFNRNYYLQTDGVHHEKTGRVLIAEHLAKALY